MGAEAESIRKNIKKLYQVAARAALCFVPGACADDAFMDALGALEEALLDLAHRENVSLVNEDGNADPEKEEAFLRVCLSAGSPGKKLSPMTRDAMMELAVAQREAQDKGGAAPRLLHSPEWYDWIAAWKEAGAAVDAVEQPFIPPDTSPLVLRQSGGQNLRLGIIFVRGRSGLREILDIRCAQGRRDPVRGDVHFPRFSCSLYPVMDFQSRSIP